MFKLFTKTPEEEPMEYQADVFTEITPIPDQIT